MKTKRSKKSQSLENRIYEASLMLEKHGFSPETMRKYRNCWDNFQAFCHERGIKSFHWKAVEQFLNSRGISHPYSAKGLTTSQKNYRHFMLTLSEFNTHGCFSRLPYLQKTSILKTSYDRLLSGYIKFCVDQKGIVFRSINHIESNAREFLFYIQVKGLATPGEISGEVVTEYFKSIAHLSPYSMSDRCVDLRRLLRYFVMRGLANPDVVSAVPTIRKYTKSRIPKVWSQEDIEKLLETVDRSSPTGKRDYAILLLAARLGMRPLDIVNLKLEDLKWDEDKIDFTQGKTGRRLELPLSNEIGSAIIEYLQKGRPKTNVRNVFIIHRAPYTAFQRSGGLNSIITKHRRMAGIELTQKSHKGLYALRHSIATHLLEVETPLETISAVMGHVTPDVTLIYTKVDVEGLRQAALELGNKGDRKCI